MNDFDHQSRWMIPIIAALFALFLVAAIAALAALAWWFLVVAS